MKTSFKRHWKAVVAFAVGGAMCLGMGVFVLANQGAQTQLDNSSQVQDDQPQLLLQSADGTHNNGGNANNGIITVSEWSETGVYGTSGSSSSSTTSNIWQSINNKAIGGVAGVCTVTLSLTTNDGTYSIPIKVANGASCSASANVLTIGGTNFTAPAAQTDYICMWKLDNASLPERITTDCMIAISYELWYVAYGATMSGTYISTGTAWTYDATNKTIVYPNSSFDDYTWVTFQTPTLDSNAWTRWIIIGAGYSQQSYLPDGATAKGNATVIGTSANNYEDGELGANQILLLSEKVLSTAKFDSSASVWANSSLRASLNNNSNTAITSYVGASNIGKVASITTYTSNSTNYTITTQSELSSSTDKVFLLATSNSTYANNAYQNFMLETYLGNTAGDKYIAYNNSNNASSRWLRSGYCGNSDYACIVSYYGRVDNGDVDGSYYGVHPCFVLNLG